MAAYTLVEIMVSVMVLSIISIAFYGALSSGFSIVQSSREDLRATQIMMQKAEAIRLCTWSQLTNFTFREKYDPLSSTNKSSGTVYTGSVTVSPATNVDASASYYPNIQLVTINLTWTNYNGRVPMGHSRQMQTQVARYGLQNYIWGATQ